MKVFVDTSAFLAVMNASDENHLSARAVWTWLVRSGAEFVSSNYVLAETLALAQSRFGAAAVAAFNADVLPLVEIAWINEDLHPDIVRSALSDRPPLTSVVDRSTIQTLRRLNIETLFAYDQNLCAEGFNCISHLFP